MGAVCEEMQKRKNIFEHGDVRLSYWGVNQPHSWLAEKPNYDKPTVKTGHTVLISITRHGKSELAIKELRYRLALQCFSGGYNEYQGNSVISTRAAD